MPRFVGPPPGMAPVGQAPPAPVPAAPPAPTDRTFDEANEIGFASLQIEQHCMFMALGLVEPGLRQAGERLQHSWAQNRPRWAQMSGPQAAPEFRYIVAETRSYQTEVLDRLNKGEWLGWLFPTFVWHIRDEMDVWTARINGQIMARQEICAMILQMAQHAAFTAHLLDPEERALIEAATASLGTLSQLHAKCASETSETILALSREAVVGLDQYLTESGIGTPKVKSVIHPVLAQHMVREGRRFVEVADQMTAAGVQF